MNEKEMFNQKLEQIGGGNMLEGIFIKGANTEKILDFINANAVYEYEIDEKGLLLKKSNELKENLNLDIKSKTFLDIGFEEILENNVKIVIAFSSNSMSNDVEVYKNNDERIIILNPNSYMVDNRFEKISDLNNENIKINKDLLYNEELSDRLIKSLHDNKIIITRSSTATIGIMAQNQTVYHGPHATQYAVAGSVSAGEQVYILSKAFGFYHIQYIVTSTGKQKQGYVPQISVQDYSGPNPEEENYYGGYCFATTELDVRTCDDFNLTAPVGTIFKNEGCTMIFHYDFSEGNRNYHVAYIEYSTTSGTKRGYVYNQYLSFPVSTCVGVLNENVSVYAGPNSNYAPIGSISALEFVSIIAKEDDDIYVEYNTNGGRKRGYIKYTQLTAYNRPGWFPDFYTGGVQSYIVDERCVVYGGPNGNYSELGAVRNEEVTCFNTNTTNINEYTFEYTCIEYTVSSTGQRKRGYVLASKVINGNLPEENNPIESFENSYPQFGTRIIYGQTQKGRNMFYYKTGSGLNHLFLTFALHGWEDGTKADGTDYHGDGNILLKVAKQFMINFANLTGSRIDDIKKKWTIYVFPGINLDGIVNGNSNNGFGRCLYNRLDPNRNWGGNFIANENSPRYKTSGQYFDAIELTNLRNVLMANKGVGKNVLIDTHGWLNQTVGNSNLGQYYWNSMGIPSSRHSYGYGNGYLIGWAKNSPSLFQTNSNYPGLGADTCLLELTPTTDYSDSNIQNIGNQFFNGTINMIENIPGIMNSEEVTPSNEIENVKSEIVQYVDENIGAASIKSIRTREQSATDVLANDTVITELSNRFKMKKALIQTVSMWERSCEGIDDPTIDLAVEQCFIFEALLEEWENLDGLEQALTPYPTRPIPYRDDSSTGFSQIFAKTAIAARNWAKNQLLIEDRLYDYNNWRDRKEIWENLKNNIEFNLETCALTLLWGAAEKGYNISSYEYSQEQIKQVLARYNGTGDEAQIYGNKNLGLYNIFESYNAEARA